MRPLLLAAKLQVIQPQTPQINEFTSIKSKEVVNKTLTFIQVATLEDSLLQLSRLKEFHRRFSRIMEREPFRPWDKLVNEQGKSNKTILSMMNKRVSQMICHKWLWHKKGSKMLAKETRIGS